MTSGEGSTDAQSTVAYPLTLDVPFVPLAMRWAYMQLPMGPIRFAIDYLTSALPVRLISNATAPTGSNGPITRGAEPRPRNAIRGQPATRKET